LPFGTRYEDKWTVVSDFELQTIIDCLIDFGICSHIYSPTGFLNDTVGNVDGVDRTIYEWVNRDGGDTDLVSDWFNLCGLSRFTPASIEFIGLFVDTSGSMALDTVRASYDKFLVDLANAGLAFVPVFNGFERWVDPFLTELVPSLE
jgi:hypothetical protein